MGEPVGPQQRAAQRALYRAASDEEVERAKKALDIPVIASLNCCAPGSWTGYAREIASAGADALEIEGSR